MHSYLIDPSTIGKTPRHLGVNVEVQYYHDRCNLWDWLVDSGATILREFHPETNLRRQPATEEEYAAIHTKRDFDHFRLEMMADPEVNIPWDQYRFTEHISWLGVPDGIVEKVTLSGLNAMLSMGYAPTSFPRPLLTEWGEGLLTDEQIDWGAAACAYEYYAAMIYRYAAHFGITYFMLHNEPEYYTQLFYMPQTFDGADNVYRTCEQQSPSESWITVQHAISKQLGVLSRLARLAMEDVRVKLNDSTLASQLFLSGPAAHTNWEAFWKYGEPYVDALDYHHYDRMPETFSRTYRRVAIVANSSNKKTAITEFNRLSGPITTADLLFNIGPALEVADLLLTTLSFTRPDDVGCEMAILYHFQFPATNRNYKNLVYGDMNVLDWTGIDIPLCTRGDELEPSFNELQLRFATPAYDMFRMLTRCVPGATTKDGYAVLDIGSGFFESGSEGVYAQLHPVVIQQPDRLIVNVLNPTSQEAQNVEFDLSRLPNHYQTAIVRETSRFYRDAVVHQQQVIEPIIRYTFPAQSLTQITLLQEDLTQINALRLEEHSTTPGTIKHLDVLQTTRLQAFAKIKDREIDVTDLHIVWHSSHPDLVSVGQVGLVQRRRATLRQVTISARTFNGEHCVKICVPPIDAV